MTEKKDFTKPCHIIGICPYGGLVEYFPLRGKAVQHNGKSLGIEPIEGEGLACKIFGHDCPIFYVGSNMIERLEGAHPGIPAESIQAILEYNWADEEKDYAVQKEEGNEAGHVFEHLQKVEAWLRGMK